MSLLVLVAPGIHPKHFLDWLAVTYRADALRLSVLYKAS